MNQEFNPEEPIDPSNQGEQRARFAALVGKIVNHGSPFERTIEEDGAVWVGADDVLVPTGYTGAIHYSTEQDAGSLPPLLENVSISAHSDPIHDTHSLTVHEPDGTVFTYEQVDTGPVIGLMSTPSNPAPIPVRIDREPLKIQIDRIETGLKNPLYDI